MYVFWLVQCDGTWRDGNKNFAYLIHGLIQVVCCCFCGWGGILLLDVLCGDNHACCQGIHGVCARLLAHSARGLLRCRCPHVVLCDGDVVV